MTYTSHISLIVQLTHHLGVMLEMIESDIELYDVWQDFLSDLRLATLEIDASGLMIPEPARFVLARLDAISGR